jgi:hypothetical protein
MSADEAVVEEVAVEEAENATSIRDTLRALEVDEMAIFNCEDRMTAERARGNVSDFQKKRAGMKKFRTMQGEMIERGIPDGPVKLYVVRVA